MATVSGSHTSIVTASNLSTGKFQLAQSSENAPVPNATKPTPLAIPKKLRPTAMAQSSQSTPSQVMQRPQSTTATPDRNHATPSTVGFSTPEFSEMVSNPLLESILRPNKDGRVKNPVPSKLKGKTDNKKGNFSVMHMGVSPGKKNDAGRDAAAERDAAARRTSENTASRAKAAQQEKYVPPRRRGLEAEGAATVKASSPFFPPREDQKQRGRPLAPDETKFEQARLLTLLRSINPITVVDQICKAVAYFGGIPGAPPPEDGIFPVSANTRETGALFIGWLAEIFPDLSLGAQRIQDVPVGSQNQLAAGPQMTPMNEPPNPRNGYGYGQAVSAPVWGLPQPPPATNPPIQNITPDAAPSSSTGSALKDQPNQLSPATPAKQPQPEAPPLTTSTSKRGRGRPKGSRNKGKSDVQSTTEAAGHSGPDTATQNHSFVSEQSHASPVAHGVSKKGAQADVSQMQTGGDQTGVSTQPQVSRFTEPSWQNNAQQSQSQPTPSVLPATVDELSPEERAVLEAFRQDASGAAKAVALSSVPGPSPAGAGVKRKRPTPKAKNIAPPLNQLSDQTQTTPNTASTLIPSNNGSMGVTGDALNWAPIDNSTPTAPAAKRQRQRKPKVSGANEPPRSQTASVTSNATPPITTHAVLESTSNSSQQPPPSRPPAEGLEAHYEKFAGRPQQMPQQNGTNHPPTVAQQQQLRQQQKSTSAVSQQKPAPVQQQQQKSATQMQQQKSQQGSQRDDQKTTQGTSARPSSTGFYNQRSHGSFSHQYPSNQASQLYGTHQTSPQMGTTSNNSNSYRSNNTHGLGQASPQFAQSDAYRTASPRTISQTSPTFSQAENTFRSTSAHSMPQPSPPYGQAEKLYRAANTQSITQPSSSFSRSHNQPQQQSAHQSHYNHFPDNPYADLPTLDNLNHGGSSGHGGVNLSAGTFGQTITGGGGLSTSSRAGSSSLYGTTSTGQGVFDTAGTSEQLLRAVSRPAGSNGVYGTTSGLGAGFEQGTSDQELRERLMRNIGRR